MREPLEKGKNSTKSDYVISEGINGYWHYHISFRGHPTFALCGVQTMHTSIPIEQWGVGRAAPEGAGISGKWCETCQRLK